MNQPLDLQEKASQKSKRWAKALIVAGIILFPLTHGFIAFAVVVEVLYYQGWSGLWPTTDVSDNDTDLLEGALNESWFWILIYLVLWLWWFLPFLAQAGIARWVIQSFWQSPRIARMSVWGGTVGLAVPYGIWHALLLFITLRLRLDRDYALWGAQGGEIALDMATFRVPILCVITVPLGYAVGAFAAYFLPARKRPAS